MKKQLSFFCVLLACLLNASLAFSLTKTQLNWIGHWKGEDKREQLVEEVKKEFEFLNPGVRVNLVYDVDLEASGDYYKWKTAHVIADMIETGEIKWDVIFLGVTVYNYVAELLNDPHWGKKHLVDFSTVEGFYESQKDFIIDTPYYKEQTGDIFVGPFIEGLITCLWYNKQVADRVGIKVSNQGMTIEEFLDYAKKLSEYNSREKTAIPFFNLSTFNRIEALFEFIFKSAFDNPHSVVELVYTQEKAQAFFDTLILFEQLAQYQPMVNERWRELGFVQWQKDFLLGSGLFLPAGTYMYGHFKGNAPDSMDNGFPVEPPIAKHPNGLVGQFSNVWAVMKNSPNREAGIALLKLWSEPKIAEKWVRYTKNPTGLKGYLSDVDTRGLHTDKYSDFVVNMTQKYSGLPMRNYRSPMYVFGKDCKVTGKSFRENLALILEGKKSAQVYFEEVMKLHGRKL